MNNKEKINCFIADIKDMVNDLYLQGSITLNVKSVFLHTLDKIYNVYFKE